MNESISSARTSLLETYESLTEKSAILKAPLLRELYADIKNVPTDQRKAYGEQLNALKAELSKLVADFELKKAVEAVEPLDVSAPFDVNVDPHKRPGLISAEVGSKHPLMKELEVVIDTFTRMGFQAIESRQLDNDWNMFGALNFPEGHPARDGYDTFRTEEGLIPPAHTSTMQNRVLAAGKDTLQGGGHIASISYGRVYRNEDIDATHEHTFYQIEGVFVSEDATLGQLLGTLRSFFESYYGQSLQIKTQPSYFPFVEPGLEFAIEKPAALGGKPGDWLEMAGCGMIHPNVLSAAGIDPVKYRGFAWGCGLERLVMLKHGIEDLRHFESARLTFLRKFI